MVDKPNKSLFRGGEQRAKRLKETYQGLSPHQLRLKLAHMDRANAKLEAQVKKLKRKCDDDEPSDKLQRRHDRAVAQNKILQSLLENINNALSGKQGVWVIGESGSIPEFARRFAELPDEVAEVCRENAELDTAARGFAALWLIVPDDTKQDIIRTLRTVGEKAHPAALEWFATCAIEADPPREPRNRKGEIVPFAKPGDKF